MKEITIDELIDKARTLTRWHFHMLAKDCKFNPNKEKFCIVLEDEESKEVFISFFDSKPLAESKQLAELAYGGGFLEKEAEGEHNKDFELILKRAEELTEKGTDWHHHHLPPNCIFNKHKGKHCIILEDNETGETLTAVYDEKPMKDLVQIERLFYRE